jgi:NADH-quinone oxidoreductase subunit L
MISRIVAYSTVSQLGLMFLALGLGAYEVAVFHVITRFLQSLFVLSSGSVIHALQNKTCAIWVKKQCQLLFCNDVNCFFNFWSSIIFFSKDEILLVAFQIFRYGLWLHCIYNDCFYMFRLMFLTFFKI